MKRCKNNVLKQLNNSEHARAFLVNGCGYHGYTCKVGRTDIAALATIHNHCTFMERIDRVLSEPALTFRLSSFDFCGIISTNLKKLDEQIIKSGVA